jgi:hypothetical protein
MREVRVQVSFSRFDSVGANLQGEFDFEGRKVKPAVLTLPTGNEKWLPAAEVRGEGIFVELDPQAIARWEKSPAVTARAEQLLRAFEADGRGGDFPGVRFYMLAASHARGLGPRTPLLERSGLRRARSEPGGERPTDGGGRVPRVPLHRGVLVRAVQPLLGPRARRADHRERSRARLVPRAPMTSQRASLKGVSTKVLEQLRDAIASGLVKPPVDAAVLIGFGVRHKLDAIGRVLAGHKRAACVAILDVALAEREDARAGPELVWTGPEAPAGTARDRAVVLRGLFESARETVILAGYTFDHARDVLAPLHEAMRDHHVDARFFVDIPQVERGATLQGEAHVEKHLRKFVRESWPFGEPAPRLYYDKRALNCGPPWCSLHAKCVVVDGRAAFVSSANFTQRGRERNIEVGVLVEDVSFASYLAGQWLGLIDAGLVAEYRG